VNTAASPPTLAVDATALWNRPISGIQRVIREVTPHLAQEAFSRGWDVALVYTRKKSTKLLVHWSGPDALKNLSSDLDRVAAGIHCHESVLYAQIRNQIRERLRVRRETRRERGKTTSSFRIVPPWLKQSGNRWLRRPSPEPISADAYLTFAAGILPAMTLPSVPPERSIYVLHDLIPLQHPEFCHPQTSRAFLHQLGELAFAPDLCRRRFVTASRYVADDIHAIFKGIAGSTVTVDLVRWGYDAKRFFPEPDPAFRSHHGIPTDVPLIVAVSTQDPRKRFAAIAAAVEQMNAYAIFLGAGDKRRVGNAFYLGHVPDEVVRQAYSSSDVVVNWSAAEGFGLPTIEALACGSRVIVPPDNKTLIEIGGDYVLVADQATTHGLCDAINRAVRLPQQSPDLSAFCWKKTAAAFTELLWPDAE
jgi:glycosyltransferase involved in cell wall biosynthesis